MRDEPILFVQWLDKSDKTREAAAVYDEIRDRIDVRLNDHDESTGPEAVLDGIQSWTTDCESAQLLFIGTHGGGTTFALGPAIGSVFSIEDIYAVLLRGKRHICLWIGACLSSQVIPALDQVQAKHPGCSPISQVVAFEDAVNSKTIEITLRALCGEYQRIERGMLLAPHPERAVEELRVSRGFPVELYELSGEGTRFISRVPGTQPTP